MDLENRIGLLVELGEFMQSDDTSWMAAKTRAFQHNAWFIPDFIESGSTPDHRTIPAAGLAGKMGKGLSDAWPGNLIPKKVGFVMAGNIPLVGFHDFLCCFICGHQPVIKLSSKDPWLFPVILEFLTKQKPIGICGNVKLHSTLARYGCLYCNRQ